MKGTADSPSWETPPAAGGAWAHAFGVTFSLRVAAAGFAFAATALIGRLLGDTTLGRLGLLLAIVDVVAGLTGPALDATLVRFAAQRITPGHDGSLPYFQRMFRVKILVVLGVVLCGVLLARPVLTHVIGPTAGEAIGSGGVVLAFTGAAVMTLLGFAQAYYQAHQRMTHYALVEFANSALRFVAVASLLAVLSQPSASILLGIYVASTTVVSLGGLALLPRAVFGRCEAGAVSLREPLVLEKTPKTLQTILTPEGPHLARFRIVSVVDGDDGGDLLFAPGVMTPSEIEGALEAGCRLLKYFPAGVVGGLKGIKNIAAPYAHLGIRFIPLGGLTPETSAEYFGSPLIAACGGSWIAPAKLIAAGDWSAIRENAAKATAIAKAARALAQKTS